LRKLGEFCYSDSMKMRSTKLLFAALGVCLLTCHIATAVETAANSEWQSLFNGKDLSGWLSVNETSFTVTNGNLRLLSGMGWLRTEKQYTNFVFEAEWRALGPGYDSGFFFRAGNEGKPWPKDGWQVNLSRTALGALVKGYKNIVPSETPPLPVNQWGKFRIEVKGTKVTLDINGERAWEYDKVDAASGYIGIQAENKAFDFRNLRVMELP
jgi:hypothetical protein